MKTKSLVALGLLGIGAYALFKKGGLLSTFSAITLPATAYGKTKSEEIEATGAATLPVKVEIALTREERKLRREEGKHEREEIRQSSKTERFREKEETRTERTTIMEKAKQLALRENQAETQQRYIEYGTSFGEWFKKMFLPTASVAEARRSKVLNAFRIKGSSLRGDGIPVVPLII